MLFKFDPDLWLVDGFERFSHWWQKNISGEQNCFWWTKICTSNYMVSLTMGLLAILWYERTNQVLLGKLQEFSFMLFCYLFIVPCILYITIKNIEETVAKNQVNCLANPFRLLARGQRIMMIIVSILSTGGFGLIFYPLIHLAPRIFSLAFISFHFWGILVFYFVSCDSLPPAKSKIKKWLGACYSAVKGLFTPRPEPAPIRVPSR